MALHPSYATVNEFKAWVGGVTGSTQDTNITVALAAASRAVDHYCNRSFGLVDEAEARLFTAGYDPRSCRYSCEITDLMTTDNLVVETDDGTGTFATELTLDTDFTLHPSNAPLDGRPWTAIRFTSSVPVSPLRVRVTGEFGWTAVPDVVKHATLLQANRIWFRRNAPAGVAGSPELGSEIRLLAKLDPDVELLLSTVRRWWGVV